MKKQILLGDSFEFPHTELPIKQFKRYIQSLVNKKWQEGWDTVTTGRKTYEFFPDVTIRLKQKNLKINFYNAQVLAGHGRFGSYLHRFKLADSPVCTCCSNFATDDIKHFLFECPAFSSLRSFYNIDRSKMVPVNSSHVALLEFMEKAMRLKFEIT